MITPREHGAYGQLGFPLTTALAIAGVTWPALALTVAAVALFVAHEPLLILLGQRGSRVHRKQAREARKTLAGSLMVAAASGLAGALELAPGDGIWIALPGALAVSPSYPVPSYPVPFTPAPRRAPSSPRTPR